MKHLHIVACFAIALVLTVTAEGAPQPRVENRYDWAIELHGASWVALRFNLTPGSDLRVLENFSGCDSNSEGETHAFVGIRNRSSIWHLTTGNAPGVWNAHAVVGIESVSVPTKVDLSKTGAGFIDGNCAGDSQVSVGVGRNDTELTLLILEPSPTGWYNGSSTWTIGVNSFDFRVGSGLGKSIDEYDQGVSASVWGLVGVATVGGGLRQTAHTNSLSFGWFTPAGELPPDDQTGITLSSCQQNGQDCRNPPETYGFRWLSGVGSTQWDFQITATAQAFERSWKGLGLFDIPCEYAPSACVP